MREGLVMLLVTAAIFMGCGRSKTEAPPRTHSMVEPSAREQGGSDDRPVIVTFGDSLTAGLGVDLSQNYPAKLQEKIEAAGYRYRVVNEGISGETSAQGRDRLGEVRAFHPRFVILELGANDGLRGLPVEETRRNLEAIVSGLERDGAKVVLAGMEMPPNYGIEYTRDFRRIFPDLAKKHHTALIPFFLAGVGGRQDLNQDDGIHPTAKGYDIVVNNVWEVLKPLLK